MTDSPDPLDTALGAKVRELRGQMKMTQTDLGSHLNLTFQQIQKYERGTNRISFSALVRIADALGCSPADLVEAVAPRGARRPLRKKESDLDTRALVQLFEQIPSKPMRMAVLDVARAAAAA